MQSHPNSSNKTLAFGWLSLFFHNNMKYKIRILSIKNTNFSYCIQMLFCI